MRVSLICLLLLPVLMSPAGAAETVVLYDGSTLSGTVRLTGDNIEVRTDHGTLTLPAWRVARVGADCLPNNNGDGASTPAPDQQTGRGTAGVLDTSVTARPAGERLAPAPEKVAASGDLRGALPPAIGADPRTVSAPPDRIPDRRATDLVLDRTGYASAVGDDGIVSVLPPGDPSRYQVRLLCVADLLVDRSDLVSGVVGLGTVVPRAGRAGALPQYASSAAGPGGRSGSDSLRRGPDGHPQASPSARQEDGG
jgi:hypothetical protein